MSDYERYIVDLVVTVLREVAEAPEKEQQPSTAIRLALRVLLPHCPERWPLTQFWDGINGTHEIGRAQTVTASFNGIVHQLHRSGARQVKR
ncbi:hypothetical protein NHF48_007455 [Sphingomonas sp. H160509]|uniref:hypothetical protein n=1 Tax=Sphingomonas sp. H160509 TaxID=2955313 RepID=UPI002096F01C|nr:hypothetical protein [Sphingomonas sp. H160509]MDD1450837.1 hypothetical protein [Sphingomonas sp. H160509]